jgi:hypothetical protein
LSILIGSLSSNSEAIVTAQTALSSKPLTIAFSKKMAENQMEVKYLLYKHKCYIEFLATEKNRI